MSSDQNQKTTITVGIPAYNEENNIQYLLDSVFAQVGNFVLEKIVVVSDGSTDSTVEITQKIIKEGRKVQLVHDENRRGKAVRLNQLFSSNTSDVLIIFDADIYLPQTDIIQKIVENFFDTSVALVSANNLPVKAENFWGKLTQYSEELWYHARKNHKNGMNFYNNSGCSFAVEKTFAKKIKLPEHSVHDQHLIYLELLKQKKIFQFAKEAVVLYRTPASWEDIIAHHSRSRSESSIEPKIQKLIGKDEKVPRYLKLYAFFIMMKKNIFYTLLSIAYLKIFQFIEISPDPLNKRGLWKINQSTKQNYQKFLDIQP